MTIKRRDDKQAVKQMNKAVAGTSRKRSSGRVLTTKFGYISIGDEDKNKAESKVEIDLRTEQESAGVRIGYDQDRLGPSQTGDMFGQKSAAKTYGILEFVRDKSRVRYGHSL
uniref:Uncharacterized protein n=2 Tax=Oryza sativa subsp. japonica TaxID=39947 RepID=A0A5S6R8Q2_ORYSJ|nr:Unknown protein [Oryza sativa Japonica Group]AAP51836.1 hypothetical protein LOC_Os10g02200 [Oryza sativa Japonica Group]